MLDIVYSVMDSIIINTCFLLKVIGNSMVILHDRSEYKITNLIQNERSTITGNNRMNIVYHLHDA